MYAGLWRILPGPLWLRIVLAILLVACILYVLATWVFPWVETVLNNQQATVEDQ